MRWQVVVAAVVLLAGCSGFSGVSGDAGTETTTLTPVSVPEQSTPDGRTSLPSTPENRLAPGLTEAGVTDPFALAGAHRAGLANRSYTKIVHTSLIGPDGTLRVVHRVVTVDAGGHRYHLVETSESDPTYPVRSVTPHLELWYDDGPALFRIGEGENVSYRVGMTTTLDGPVGDISGHDRLVGLYGTVDRWSVEPALGWNSSRFVLESQESPDDDVLHLPVFVENPTNAELQVVMTGDGRVSSHRLTYDASFDDTPVRVIERVRYVKVGRTVVDRPEWYEEAQRETTDERRGQATVSLQNASLETRWHEETR